MNAPIDITETLAPKSDQLNADDLMAGPRTVTITAVSRGDADQPVNVTTAEFGDGRPFKPCKSMRRVMVAAWGPDASIYVGRRMTLYRDEKVRFGGQDVGGIRISHLSHIDKRLSIALTVTRGKRAPFVVVPLPDKPAHVASDTGNMSTETRKKWEKAMFAALNDGDCADRNDQLIVITALAGRSFTEIPEHRDGITDDELRAVVGTLADWKKAGRLGPAITDVITSYVEFEAASVDTNTDEDGDP